MKVKDFLKEFEGVDPESEMIFYMNDGCCGEKFNLEDPIVDNWGPFRVGDTSYCALYFSALDFLTSCRASSTAQSAVAAMRAKK